VKACGGMKKIKEGGGAEKITFYFYA